MTVLLAATFVMSCSQGKNSNEEHDATEAEGHDHGTMEADDHHDEGEQSGRDHGSEMEENHEGHDDSSTAEGDSKTWKPEGNGAELIANDFHFIVGTMDDITPKVIQSESGENLLAISSDGTPSAFVFHQAYGNIGMAAMVNTSAFEGSLKLIHHAQNEQNYEFVSINGTNMTLGRVVNGEEKIFNEGKFTSTDWINLRVSAAGSHFKGYIGSKSITHGHGDKMKDGFVGIMMEGKGSIQIKSIEIAVLEDE